LSQGAKPGGGGLLPQPKISAEIAAIRGISRDRDCVSPSSHSAFRHANGLLDFVEAVAAETGLPVGIKSAVGDSRFWADLTGLMAFGDRGVDFITIDSGEGGTGAGPLVFTDHVALPFKVGFARVYKLFVEHNLHQRVVFIGSGRLGFPESALFAFALGCDLIAVGREALLAIGCIQAQRCHTKGGRRKTSTPAPPVLSAGTTWNSRVVLRSSSAMRTSVDNSPTPPVGTR
jgi:glutamate synthase domain-containing protein 2